MENKDKDESKYWDNMTESALFDAMEEFRVFGTASHFYMIGLSLRIKKFTGVEIPPQAIYRHLQTLYNTDIVEAEVRYFEDDTGIGTEIVEFELPFSAD